MELIQTDTGGLLGGNDAAGSKNGILMTVSNTVARTDTTAKTLGFIPAGAILVASNISNPAISDAGTTAVVSAGKSGGTGVEYLNTVDVKGGNLGIITPTTKATLGTVGGANVIVTGIYAETGGASTVGGPWRVNLIFYVP